MRYFLCLWLLGCESFGLGSSDKYQDTGEETLEPSVAEPTTDVTSEPTAEPPSEPTAEPTSEPSANNTSDADGDGFSQAQGDCDDSDPNISPSALDLAGDGRGCDA